MSGPHFMIWLISNSLKQATLYSSRTTLIVQIILMKYKFWRQIHFRQSFNFLLYIAINYIPIIYILNSKSVFSLNRGLQACLQEGLLSYYSEAPWTACHKVRRSAGLQHDHYGSPRTVSHKVRRSAGLQRDYYDSLRTVSHKVPRSAGLQRDHYDSPRTVRHKVRSSSGRLKREPFLSLAPLALWMELFSLVVWK